MINARLIKLLSNAKKYVYYQVLSQWLILILRILITFFASYLVDSYIDNTLTSLKILFLNKYTIFFTFYFFLDELHNIFKVNKIRYLL